MPALAFSHSFGLVLIAYAIANVAGFTGLSLTRNMAAKTPSQRKVAIALAALALGGGIWSMHFVAMLGLQLPIPFYYDAAITLVSALVAILVVGASLILLHYKERTTGVIVLAGVFMGLGILLMHYIGMAGLELCQAVYTLPGLIESSVAAIGLCVLAVWVAYQERNTRNIFLATLCFGFAVSAVHFLAMSGTDFVEVPQPGDFGPPMSNEALAIGVILSSFVIFGAFLWVGATYLETPEEVAEPELLVEEPAPDAVEPAPAPAPETTLQIPCEREGIKVYVAPRDVAFLRADGHYTQVYTDSDRLFCAWPITEAAKRLGAMGFVQTHRSYLVNSAKVARFERSKDKGRCTFANADLPPAPVSRSKLRDIQSVLSGIEGATGAA